MTWGVTVHEKHFNKIDPDREAATKGGSMSGLPIEILE
jgi:hypothetical protein